MNRLIVSVAFVFSIYALLSGVAAAQADQTLSYTTDARTSRISSLKTEYRIKLTDKEKELISSRCQNAQKSLEKIADKLETTHTARSKDYQAIINLLSSLSPLFEKKQIDASTLDLLVVSYQQKKEQFETSATNYEIALADATSLDCAANPEDFRAALEGVRAARKEIVTITADITETTKASLKTTLDSLKLRLSTEQQ